MKNVFVIKQTLVTLFRPFGFPRFCFLNSRKVNKTEKEGKILLNSYIFIRLHFKTGLVRYFKTMKLNWNLYSLLYDWDKFLGYVFLTKEIKYKFIWEHPGYARRQIMFSKKKLAVILCKMLCGNSYLLSFCRIVCTEINVNLKVRVAHCLARVALKSSLCCFNMGPINVFEQRTDMN